MSSLLFYPHLATPLKPGKARGSVEINRELVERIVAAYRRNAPHFGGSRNSMWSDIGKRTNDIDECLVRGSVEDSAKLLGNPVDTDLFYGFDSLAASIRMEIDAGTQNFLRYIFDCFVRLSEAVGADRMWGEEGSAVPYEARSRNNPASIEHVLSAIEAKLGIPLDFPNPFPCEIGIETSRGIIGYRCAHAIYQAWRVCELLRRCRGRVLEIGAGLGRTAYYAHRMGITDYTIIDIPKSNVAQALFLGRTLGPDAVWLAGEPIKRRACVRIVPPQWMKGSVEKFDVVLNVDSLTELDRNDALGYVEQIEKNSCFFLSINHESGVFTVSELFDPKSCVQRTPYWLRKGYVEELFQLSDIRRTLMDRLRRRYAAL